MSRRKLSTRASSAPYKASITIKDVAARAGVSTATVSRVLAGQNGVGKRVRELVSGAVQALDYQPNRLARDLRVGLRKVIGVILPDLQNPFLTSVVRGIEAVLCREGYSLLLGHSDSITEREKTQLAVFRGEGVAGLILIPNAGPDADYAPLKAWNIPVVVVDRAARGLQVDLVQSNNQEAMREATSHLLSHGYKDIAFINGSEGMSVTGQRLAGYVEALKEASLAYRESLVIHSDFRQEGGYCAMVQLLALPKRPRAVVIANNLMTLGALQAIHEQGLRIPEDVAVLGFDDMPWAISLRPALTAVAQPAEEIGQTAAQLLLDRLNGPPRVPRQVILPATLVVRASCGGHPVPSGVARNPAGSKRIERPAKPAGATTKS